MGSSLKTYITFRQSEKLTLKLGVYGLLYYGEEAFFSDVKPLASYSFHLDELFIFTMGWIDNEQRHYMLDALQWERLEYTRQVDYGFQAKLRNPHSALDIWTNWNLLNTPEHREYLDGGVNLHVYFWTFDLNLQRYWSHHGGTLYMVGPMTNNYSLAIGVDNRYVLGGRVVKNIGYKFYYLSYGDIYTLTSWKGNGALGEAYVQLCKNRIYIDYWAGYDFITEEGNPLYRHNEYLFTGLRTETRISNKADFVFEFRVYMFLDIQDFGGQGRFEIRRRFGYPLQKHKDG
jgi:hypothetical protein